MIHNLISIILIALTFIIQEHMIKLGNYFVVNCHTGSVEDASHVLQAIGCLGTNQVRIFNDVFLLFMHLFYFSSLGPLHFY